MSVETLSKILQIATAMSPLAVIALALMIIFMLVRKEDIMRIFTRKKPADVLPADTQHLEAIYAILNKIATNHLHELPDMRKDLTSILEGQKEMSKAIGQQGERLAKVEGVLKINI